MVYIGIDIAKRAHVLSAVGEDGRPVIESFSFANTEAGFKKLLERLRKAGVVAGESLAGMEATGHYWIALFDFLTSHGYEAAVINPIQTDAFRDVWTVRKVKTDAIDAAMIADLVRYKRYVPSALGDEAVDEVESELARLLDETPGRWLLTVPGIGIALASTIAGEIGDANRFEGPHQLMAFAGMDPTKNESGETVASDGKMSKRGSGALRWAFMQAADSVRKCDPYFGDYFAKKKGCDRKHHYVALSGVARKLMGVCLALMKEQRPYEPAPPRHHRPGHLGESAE